MKHTIALCLSYLVFGLGSLPDGMPPTDGGMIVISIFDSQPKIERPVTSTGVYLFSVEL